MIRLLSIPRTGTRFMKKVFHDANVAYFHSHFWGVGNIPPYEGIVVVPMRDKETCRPRWMQYHQHSQYDFDKAWDEMNRYIADSKEVYIIHVDNPDVREQELANISRALGIELTADFSVKVGEGRP